ncbi:hypothetical protein [Arthrobacter alpinus]|nr:hypothetical protein [Arthrobacter alpinus]
MVLDDGNVDPNTDCHHQSNGKGSKPLFDCKRSRSQKPAGHAGLGKDDIPMRLTLIAEQGPGVRRLGRCGVTFLILLSLLVILLAAGCAKTQEPEMADLDLKTAKSTTMANERDMISVIEPEDIVEVDQKDESSLLRCSDGRHLWTGRIHVALVPGADGAGYVQVIKEAWTGKDGWKLTERTTAQGQEVVDILNDDGYNHGIGYSENDNAIRITSFSPCFTMDPPYEYGNKY